jgi:hypothetical protein
MHVQTKRPARPRRGQFDAARYDGENLYCAQRVIADPQSPAGLRDWARRFLARRSTTRCCLCGQPAFSSVAVLCRACHRRPTFSDDEQKRIAQARTQREGVSA